MPITVLISPVEAEAIKTASATEIKGCLMTFNLSDATTILSKIPEGEARLRLARRFAAIGTQLNVPNTIFNPPASDAPEIVPEAEPAPEKPRRVKFKQVAEDIVTEDTE